MQAEKRSGRLRIEDSRCKKKKGLKTELEKKKHRHKGHMGMRQSERSLDPEAEKNKEDKIKTQGPIHVLKHVQGNWGVWGREPQNDMS